MKLYYPETMQKMARPVIFGEVLFDVFPDGEIVMGGAPLNVAWHLKGFGINPLLVSRLGSDDNGQSVLDKMTHWGLDVSGIQRDEIHPTGRVEISLKNGQPEFSILPEQAYDYIDTVQARAAVEGQDIAMLYHGSLAVRNPVSLAALNELKAVCNGSIFVDINLREPWWNHHDVDALITSAHWLKLNDAELIELSNNPGSDLNLLAEDYVCSSKLKHLVLTLGDKGACLFEHGNILKGDPVPAKNILDTVGAGDAFSSVIILGALMGWSSEVTMPRALAFASLLCTIRGATIPDPEKYKALLKSWGG